MQNKLSKSYLYILHTLWLQNKQNKKLKMVSYDKRGIKNAIFFIKKTWTHGKMVFFGNPTGELIPTITVTSLPWPALVIVFECAYLTNEDFLLTFRLNTYSWNYYFSSRFNQIISYGYVKCLRNHDPYQDFGELVNCFRRSQLSW